MDSLDLGGVELPVPVQEDEGPSLQSLVLLVLLYRCETWTLTRDLRWRLYSFGARSLGRILGYRWTDFVSNERLLRERDSNEICYLHSPWASAAALWTCGLFS